jgi:hypothetical protein
MESDVMLYVVGSVDENEVLLYRYRLTGKEVVGPRLTTMTASSSL